MRIINWIIRIFRKTKQPDKKQIISYEKNKIYPVDEFAEARINQALDHTFNKHHGIF